MEQLIEKVSSLLLLKIKAEDDHYLVLSLSLAVAVAGSNYFQGQFVSNFVIVNSRLEYHSNFVIADRIIYDRLLIIFINHLGRP